LNLSSRSWAGGGLSRKRKKLWGWWQVPASSAVNLQRLVLLTSAWGRNMGVTVVAEGPGDVGKVNGPNPEKSGWTY